MAFKLSLFDTYVDNIQDLRTSCHDNSVSTRWDSDLILSLQEASFLWDLPKTYTFIEVFLLLEWQLHP